jgi:hypothetical protein
MANPNMPIVEREGPDPAYRLSSAASKGYARPASMLAYIPWAKLGIIKQDALSGQLQRLLDGI